METHAIHAASNAASRAPAPGGLALVQATVNSSDNEERREEWETPEALRDWLRERGLLENGERLTEDDLRRAIDVRAALRAALLANNGADIAPWAVAALNRAAAEARLVVRFDTQGQAHLEPDDGGINGAIGRLLAIVNTAMAEGTWPRLKACRDEGCQWAFYDESKNRSGAWCSMAECGSRSKARAYRQRRRELGVGRKAPDA